jgi:hypothetical protein
MQCCQQALYAVYIAACACTCLQEVEDDDEDDDEDDEDVAAEDEELLGAAADLLPALAASMGQDAYAAAFLSLHAEPLLARLRPQQPAALRAIAAGAAAEVAEALGGRIAAVVEPLLPLMLRELQAEVRVNVWQGACISELSGYTAEPLCPLHLQPAHHVAAVPCWAAMGYCRAQHGRLRSAHFAAALVVAGRMTSIVRTLPSALGCW